MSPLIPFLHSVMVEDDVSPSDVIFRNTKKTPPPLPPTRPKKMVSEKEKIQTSKSNPTSPPESKMKKVSRCLSHEVKRDQFMSLLHTPSQRSLAVPVNSSPVVPATQISKVTNSPTPAIYTSKVTSVPTPTYCEDPHGKKADR